MQQKEDIREPFLSLWEGKDVFQEAFALKGEVFRAVKNRETLRILHDGTAYFIKRHRPSSWKEILKNYFQFKKPVLGADNEYLAIRKLEELNVDTMKIRAFAMKGNAPAGLYSFLITDELRNKISLEDFTKDWKTNPPDPVLRKKLIRNLAETCSKMHYAGLNHRDCYLCHFLLNNGVITAESDLTLTVLDLHRAQIRKVIPRRMRIKDLAGIFFSSMDLGLTRMDMLRFIAVYQKPGKLSAGLWRQVWNTACKLYRKEYGRSIPYSQ